MAAADLDHFVLGIRHVPLRLQEGIYGACWIRSRCSRNAPGSFLLRCRPSSRDGPSFLGRRPPAHLLKQPENVHEISHSAGRRTAFITSRRTRVRSRRMRLPVAVPNFSRKAFGSSLAIEARPPACRIGLAFLSMCCSSKQVTVAPAVRLASFLASISPC